MTRASAASATSALPVARAELRKAPLVFGHRRLWSVKDPVAQRYYQLREEEKFILDLLDGKHTLDQIVVLFEQRFAPQRLRRDDLSAFLLLLHREGLVVPAAWGQGAQLWERRRRAKVVAWVNRLSNVLAIQLGGVNPNAWLSRVTPRLDWLFSPAFLVAAVAWIGVAGAIVATQFAILAERVPRFHEFFAPQNLVWLAVAMGFVKTAHELGHAIVCKRLGGECTRLGLMLLVFTPALYCQVSDAWMFPRKSHRIAVSAAGMVVELLLAATATILWASTHPGLFNALCLNVMVVCSVGTLVINGNPLLRYDGYYILADLVGVPNLGQQAATALDQWLIRALTGVRLPRPPGFVERQVAPLMLYAVASRLYRLLAIVGVLWLLHAALAPRGLAVLVQLAAVLIAASLLATPSLQIGRFLRDPRQRSQLRTGRILPALAVVVALVAALLVIPLPARVTAPVVLRPSGGRAVYVVTSGMVENSLEEGAVVGAGQELARLRNRALELETAVLAARHQEQRMHVRHLELRQHDVATLADELPAARKMLADLQEQLTRKRGELARLVLTAPRAGIVLPPRRRPETRDALELSSFTGTPLEPTNRGCLVEAGTLFCTIGDPSRLEVLALVDEASVPLVAPGQTARVQLAESPGQTLVARVVDVAQMHGDDLPPELVETGVVPVSRAADGRSRPLTTWHQVVLEFDAHDRPLLLNATGWARIHVAAQPLWLRLYRSLRGTFRVGW